MQKHPVNSKQNKLAGLTPEEVHTYVLLIVTYHYFYLQLR